MLFCFLYIWNVRAYDMCTVPGTPRADRYNIYPYISIFPEHETAIGPPRIANNWSFFGFPGFPGFLPG